MKKLGINDILETQRCIMKIPQEGDAIELWNLIDNNVSYFMNWEKGDNPEHILERIKRIRNDVKLGKGWYAGVYLGDQTCIGLFGIPELNDTTDNIEIGFWIGKKYWGKGYIPECFEKIKEVAFKDLEVETIHITVNPENVNCKRVAEKCGLSYDGTLKKWMKIKGELIDTEFYSITKEYYLNYLNK